MGWYSQGTQVVDFTENADGTIDFKEAGYFIPADANEWVSHIFKVRQNANGTFTYWGATGDFNLGESGRNTIDVYKVTLPAPPKPLGTKGGRGSRQRRRQLATLSTVASFRVRCWWGSRVPLSVSVNGQG